MLPKAPKKDASDTEFDLFKAELAEEAETLRRRFEREFHRKELRSRVKLYASLAAKRPEGSMEQKHFERLGRIYAEALEAYGEETPPKRRPPRAVEEQVDLIYPDLPESCPLRIHFLAQGSLLRRRAAALSAYAPAVARQVSPTGEVLLSTAMLLEQVFLFERLVETLGSGGHGIRFDNAGFRGCPAGLPRSDAAK